jgi:two-component system response regulator MprA
MARILVIDDDPGVTALLARGLGYEGHAVDVASSGEDGLGFAAKYPPDLVLLDVTLPGLDGFQVCRRLRESDPQLPILMLTARDSPSDQVRGLETGADDYVVKPFVLEVLAARVNALMRRREAVAEPEVLSYRDLTLDTGGRRARRGEREVELTTTEYELLRLLLRNAERVLTRGLIMHRVWGYDFDGNHNVLEVYVRYLRTKLEAGGELRLIQTVRGAGYVLRESE